MKTNNGTHWLPRCMALTLCLCLCACSTPDKITLLPNPDGSVGNVIVHSGGKTQVIDRAYTRADVSKGGAIEQTADNKAAVEAQYADLLAAEPPRPRTFTINFVFDSATQLAPESAATVAELKKVLATWPAPHLTVVGHTDMAGSQEFNDRLSTRRAQSVASFLVKSGIPAQQIEVAGRGKREPLVHTADGVPNQANRRAVITVQ
ncbi:OmpA family protein [Paraburkholderia sp. CNPSo 3274]|uniref:OmpA family protein n=1 Tax=Paraburkholderia sp. CNPSo 3274 TaxID=2940932 RepID=UPI0020B8A300|nr:OmpA family protein [Paraburkholderia sp. CNPSo 3274]MCP3705955.1 OmpA family protein [Paraburkholderia sp. CNPSo 3274]